jgi:TolB protein
MMLRHLRLPLLSLLAVLALAGCNSASSPLLQRLDGRAAPAVSNVAPDSPDNQLLVQGADGNIYLVSPDGAQRFALTDDGSASRIYSQPAWSADGSRIAWSKIDRRGSALVTSQYDGSERSEVRVPFAPFYIAWSPRGDQLAYLSNWTVVEDPSIALRLVDVNGEESQVQTLVNGQPLYFSWAPDGERLLTHIGNERVEVQAVTGEQTPVVISGGAFQSPQWAPDGASLVYALADAIQQYLVVADLEGNLQQEITDFDGQITFAMSPDGAQVAYVASARDAGANTLGPLYVVDMATQATRAITERPVVAFAWSPDAQKLAYLTLEPLRNRVGMRWNVWDGSQRTAYSTFSPTSTFLNNYLPFFDQYAQSHRIWSPASDALVYAGQLTDGRSGIWVQGLAEDQAPQLVGPGVFASWSPR